MVTIQILHQIIFTTLLERKSCQNYGQNSVSPHWSVFVRLKVVIGIGMFFFQSTNNKNCFDVHRKNSTLCSPSRVCSGKLDAGLKKLMPALLVTNKIYANTTNSVLVWFYLSKQVKESDKYEVWIERQYENMHWVDLQMAKVQTFRARDKSAVVKWVQLFRCGNLFCRHIKKTE